jgi:cystathionine gamma-synthase
VTEGETAPTVREGTGLREDDVYLYPAGMSAIFHAHQAALRWRRQELGLTEEEVDKAGKSISFG